MSRINTNIASMNAISKLVSNNADLSTRLQRLSSGLRINTGKDDPAGLIASENLRSEMSGLEAGIKNSSRASSVIATAEGALNEISALLIDIKGLLVETANKGALSTEEVNANQLQVDSALNSVDRIANATEFEGMKLLNGNLDYTVGNYSDATDITDVQVNAAKLIDGATMTVSVNQTAAATQGTLTLGVGGAGTLSQQTTIQVTSNRGTTELTFAVGADILDIEAAIVATQEVTGVESADDGSGDIYSVDYGTDSYVTVSLVSGGGGANAFTGAGTDAGSNATAIINGTAATGNGQELTIRTGMLDAKILLTSTFGVDTTSFDITGGGADFAIGSRVDAIGMEAIGIPNIATGQLGYTDAYYLSSLKSGATNALSSDNLYTAQRVIDQAIKDVSVLRGRLGAFQKNVLETNINSLGVTLENVTASESAIRDADFASETAALTRSQILVQANTSILSLANSMPQSVLALLK
jgi:flagellin